MGEKHSANRKSDYERLLEEWLAGMRAGIYSHKKKPISRSYERKYLRPGQSRFWKILGESPSVAGISAKNLARCYSSSEFEVDWANRRDSHSIKMSIYRFCTRFVAFLIKKGLKTQEDLDEFRALVPNKTFSVKRRKFSREFIDEAIRFNRTWAHGRSSYDIEVTEVLIMMYAFLGIRRSGAIGLRISDIFFNENRMIVMEKGAKERYVPLNLFPEIKPKMQEWLNHIRPDSSSDLFLVQENGKPLTETSVNGRFTKLRTAMNRQKAYEQLVSEIRGPIDRDKLWEEANKRAKESKEGVRPHALRYAFATMLSNRGMPLPMLQLILGHEHITTTQAYILTSFEDIMTYLENSETEEQTEQKPVGPSVRELLKAMAQEA